VTFYVRMGWGGNERMQHVRGHGVADVLDKVTDCTRGGPSMID